jgi:hypothetical protein
MKSKKPAPPAPTHEEIARRAYEIFLNRGGDHGHDMEDWLQAEQQLVHTQAA